jgi:hypothetical protein
MTRQRCSAQRSKGRGQCGAYAIHGATVCRAHGGRAPQVKRKAAERLALAEFERKYGGGEPDATADPAGVMLREIGWSSTHVAWLRSKLQEEGAQWADRYDRERQTLLKLAATAHQMGIAEREVRLAEELGATLVMLVNRIAGDLHVKYRATLRRSFGHHLAELNGAPE